MTDVANPSPPSRRSARWVQKWIRNPVLRREMQERMQTRRGAIAITFWLVLLSAAFLLVYQTNATLGDFGGPVVDVGRIGREIFEWVLFVMLLLVLFLVPAFTSSTVAGERERQTLVPLQVTLLSPAQIVIGKIAAAVVFVVLLVVLTAPLLAASFLIGGVSIGDMVRGLLMVLLTAVVVGSLGVACSATAKRVQTATVLTYAIVLAMAVGTLIGLGALALVDAMRGFDTVNPPKEILMFNPFVATADVFDSGSSILGFGDTATPLGGLRSLLDELDSSDRDFILGPERDETTRIWRWYVVASIALTYSAVVYAASKVRAPAEAER